MEAVRPHAFVDGSHALPSRCASTDVATLQFSLPTTLPKSSENYVFSVRRLRSDVPAGYSPRRPARESVVTAAVPSHQNDLKKLSGRRARGRVATIEAVDPDVDAEGLMNETLYARLEEAYRRPSFATLMSDFKAKLGDSVLNDEDINSYFGFDSGDSTVELQSRAEAAPVEDALLLSNAGKVNRNGKNADSELSGEKASSSALSPKVVKKRGLGRRSNVEGNRILKITKNPVTRRPRKLALALGEPKEIVSREIEQPVEEPVAENTVVERGGKRRLSLRSRIAMKQSKQDLGVNYKPSSATDHPQTLSLEDQQLWSQETEDLINKYSTSLDLTAPLWDHLDRGLLSAAEENRLAIHMKPMKKMLKLHKVLMKQLGREPTDDEWASAAGVELSILRRRLALGRAARTKLIQRNLRLVLSQAYKYYKESMSLSIPDLCQEGVVGLMQAVDKFDPGKGYRFSTYGIYWIRNSILRAQTKSGHMLRSPHNVSTHRVNIKRARVELEEKLGRPPTNDEIQNHLGIAADRFRDILRTNMRPSSLHEVDRVTGREKVENLASDEDAMTTYAGSTSMVQYGLDDVLDSLRPKENIVLRQRYGLDGKGQRSLSEVGLILNLSREMVRRHELRGILKLQHPTRVEYLRNYLN
ncbi:hypothetical protein M758_11G164300 [Ceratodon purpureus]|nr:hypothetical protein M758_11G164300 [Ceratodon purpureus]